MQTEPEYDILIVGSGLGGLVCGAILSAEGFRVCILEKNRQFGGCLQTFARDKVLFDSGVHYLGGLSKGQTLHQIFRFLGLLDQLQFQQMDEKVFDRIVFLEDGKEYDLAQGYDQFINTLSAEFPDEKENLRQYCEKIKEICNRFPMYNLRYSEGMNEKAEVLDVDTKEYIESVTSSKRLQEILAGNNMLYAGEAGKTPLFVHALVTNSYIQSAWKCVDGGSQITKHLVHRIRENGGVVQNYSRVAKFHGSASQINSVELTDGTQIRAKNFISNLHPQQTLSMTDSVAIRPVYRKRINGLENGISSFTVHLVMKKESFPYYKHNYYVHEKDGVWDAIECRRDEWPKTCGIFFSANSRSSVYAESICLLTYMPYSEMSSWAESFNTDSIPGERGADYEAFKSEKAELLISFVERKFPELRNCIHSYYTSSPLTYRDYIGTADGAMYGISKDRHQPMANILSPSTRIKNLSFTGQNLMLHGILGVSISALTTCGLFTNLENLVEKIKHA